MNGVHVNYKSYGIEFVMLSHNLLFLHIIKMRKLAGL